MRQEQLLFVHLRTCALFVWPMRQQNHQKTTNTQKTPSDGNRSTMIFCKFVYLCIHQQNHSLRCPLMVQLALRLAQTSGSARALASTWASAPRAIRRRRPAAARGCHSSDHGGVNVIYPLPASSYRINARDDRRDGTSEGDKRAVKSPPLVR